MALVYLHTCIINDKKYCGMTTQKINERWGKNGSRYLEKNSKGEYVHPHFARAIIKYGWENFIHEVILDNVTEEEALNYEKQIVDELDLTNPNNGYNCCDGGNKPPVHYGKDNAFFGKRPDEAIQASVEKRSKKIINKDTGFVFNSMISFSIETGINKTKVTRMFQKNDCIIIDGTTYSLLNSNDYRTDSEENSLHE